MRKIFYYLLILVLPFFILNNSMSNENLYLIERIKCQAESTSAVNAKDIAIKQAEKEALQKLFDRLNVDRENVKFINSEILNRIVDSVHISDEVVTPTKYSSEVDIYFNEGFVDYYLNQYGIKDGGVIRKRYLYIPILKVKNNYYNLLNNIWREKTLVNLQDLLYRGFELPENFNILDQNPINHVLINKKSIEETEYNDFLELLKEHNSNTLVFAIAEYSSSNDNIEITLKEVLTDNVLETKLNMFNKENLSYDELMNDTSLKVLQYFINTTVNKQRANTSNETTKVIKSSNIKLHTLQNDINESVFMLNLLRSLSFITECNLEYQTTKEACFNVVTNADANFLYSLFKENGLLLQFRNSKYYVVYTGL